MRAVVRDWQPRNRITTPLAGTPSYVNSGIIKAVMKNGEKISVAQIDYQEFDEENFQYVFSPWRRNLIRLPNSNPIRCPYRHEVRQRQNLWNRRSQCVCCYNIWNGRNRHQALSKIQICKHYNTH